MTARVCADGPSEVRENAGSDTVVRDLDGAPSGNGHGPRGLVRRRAAREREIEHRPHRHAQVRQRGDDELRIEAQRKAVDGDSRRDGSVGVEALARERRNR